MTTAFILPGKTGDVLSGLRIVQSFPGKQNVVVSAKYAPVLAGLDWVEPVIWDGDWDDLAGAIRFAKKKFHRVINLATYGKDFPIQNRTPSFQHDQALRGGAECNDLILDLPRSGPPPERSRTILVADESESSPFPHRDDLWNLLNERYGKTHTITRLDQKLPNFKDFLPLYDAADLLITIETAHLHLSAATRTPVIALAVDNPGWRGSAYHPRFAFYCRYSEFQDRKPEFINSIEDVLAKRERVRITPIKTEHPFSYNPSIIQHEGRLLTSYRYHSEPGRWRTSLAITDGDKTWPIEVPVDISSQSVEDPKLFLFDGKLCVSFTVSKFDAPAPPIPCIVAFGKLEPGPDKWKLIDYTQIGYGKNDWSGQEKNFVFFEA